MQRWKEGAQKEQTEVRFAHIKYMSENGNYGALKATEKSFGA